jgi:plastocyanin
MKIGSLVAVGLIAAGLAACGPAAPSSGDGTAIGVGSPGASEVATAIVERDFEFDTPDVTVQGGTSLAVTNAGPTVHNLAVRDASGAVVATTRDLKPGTSETLPIAVPTGTYTMFCSLPGHESLGLKGTLTVLGR